MREYNFDCLAGPTHHYAGLSYGNLASAAHRGKPGDPRAAALQGLEKMRLVSDHGVGQALLPPQLRPDLRTLHRLGFTGSTAAVLERVARAAPELLALCGSASAMWAANAATVSPSCDTADGKLHLTAANLTAMFHRSIEARATTSTLRDVFADERYFRVHEPLPASELFSDEGAANHSRLANGNAVVHLFGWGRAADATARPTKYPARQTREASQALARLHELDPNQVLCLQQAPAGIDAGAFHSDVLCVGSDDFLMLHELAFVDTPGLLAELRRRLGDTFSACVATEAELPVSEAIAAYPFNSQLVRAASGRLLILAPEEARASSASRRFLERVVAESDQVEGVQYVDVNGSMKNGGGPACLRLRVPLSDAERAAVTGRVFFDRALYDELGSWIARHYRDRVSPEDLADPVFFDENRSALSELSRLLGVRIDLGE